MTPLLAAGGGGVRLEDLVIPFLILLSVIALWKCFT